MNLSLLKELFRIEDLLAWAKDCVVKINDNFLNIKNREDLREVDFFGDNPSNVTSLDSTIIILAGQTSSNLISTDNVNKKRDQGEFIVIASVFIRADANPGTNKITLTLRTQGNHTIISQLSFTPSTSEQQYILFGKATIKSQTLDNFELILQNNTGVTVYASKRQIFVWRVR
jgi:hypothetical protein